MGAIVGIDLGTTNSLVAARDAYGRPAVIADAEGGRLTPSVVYFGCDPPAVGREAKEWARVGHDEVASVFKPHVGDPEFSLRFHGRDYDATKLSALVLGKLKANAEAHLKRGVDRAVITVPAYFADSQRKATIEAGRLAGLEVRRIVNEPTAAALAYGLQKEGPGETVLIYDLGGGTFDVTVARVEPDTVEVLATAGDHDLGGKNWDDRVASYLAEKFRDETGVDPLDDPLALNEVLLLAEAAKWTLSERTTARVTLQLGSVRRGFELSRGEFEAMTRSLLERTSRLVDEAIGEAGLTWPRLDGVLLVGGSTRMPMVRRLIKEASGRDARAGVNVDEVVALGAAIQAAIDDGEETGDARPHYSLAGARRVIDVMSHSLGVVAVSADGRAFVNDVLIRRNAPIPAEAARPYLHATHGGANDRLEVYLTQGESDRPLDCDVLGRYAFRGFHVTDAEVTVDLRLSYDLNGIVQVEAIQRDTGHRLEVTVEPVPDDLSWLGRPPETIEEAGPATRVYLLIDVSASMAGGPLLEAQNAARAFLEACDFTRTEVGLISFSDVVNLQADATNNARKVGAAIARLEADGTTNLADALALARTRLTEVDRRRYVVILTDGYPDAAEAAADEATEAHAQGIEVVAIGIGSADRDYLRRIASTEAGSIFADQGELVRTFGQIGRMIAGLRANARAAYDLALAGAIGGVFGLFFYVEAVDAPSIWTRDALAGGLIGGAIGYALAASGPLRDRAWPTLARASTWGALAGAVGGAIGLVLGEVVLGRFQGGLLGRAASWGVLGVGIGIGQGFAYGSRQKLAFGLVGGAVGGLVGGALLELIRAALGDRYDLGQGLGVVALGGGLGLGLALVEQALRRAWVTVASGRQVGRSYLLDRGPSAIGLDERAAVGLFGDPEVARRHAEIEVGRGVATLRPLDGTRTTLNGRAVAGPESLRDGDAIEVGRTRLVFRDRRGRDGR